MKSSSTTTTTHGSSSSGVFNAAHAHKERDADAFSIRDSQIESVNRMLNVKSVNDSKTNWQEVWKVLIFDQYCSTIIAPILTKGLLRQQGITLHLMLHSERQPIQDVPAIYFVMPTQDNIKRIAEDCRNHLYDSVYVNFATKVPTALLEELATLTIQYDVVHLVSKVHDQFLNYISLEKDLFVLNSPHSSYASFNNNAIKDTKAQENMDIVVDSLFSVLVTMGVVPIIRCPKNTAAEMIAQALEKKISQHLATSGNLFSANENSSGAMSIYQRPVLILLDRNIDLSVMMHHPWTYQALAHDILDMKLNRVKVEVTNDNQTKRVPYDLDSSIDTFWQNNTGAPFPNVAGEVKAAISDYTAEKEKIGYMTDVTDDSSTEPGKQASVENRAKGLGDLVSSLKEKKRLIDLHTNLATDLMKHIRDRQIDYFFSMEEAIITRSLVDKKELTSLITSPPFGKDGGRGTLEDKVRLFLIYFMSSKTVPEMEQFEEALKGMGADLKSIEYIKKNKAFKESLAIVNSSSQSSSATAKASGFLQMFTPVESFTNYFSQGVRSLLPKSKDLFVTRVVESIMDLKNTLDADYIYLDPKIQNKNNVTRRTSPFKDAIVFVVGGGNYVEYQNLQDFAKKQNKKIIYGTTELLTSKEFIEQTKELSL
ncbi:hypothetical protein SAMD00019534_086150 [Acytostelium subglobosum LB1]|uniref:hypothetical protein n=1 Tax=Acytostelium subglobosum LB1 TaxID=1410327 RepID=UPI000644BFB7|nr:hypothetical protein SAMD00019534_086150 [Acytostelium subglobosum LB1]GAM25440.1 hypothetical protein SAMD00019534_086150 [Acytostelium subglobosum LB1]|eukprot:XP_012751426.1 hypothetical protein SAMD00019534_086150 [Acytostelium subglobosum LB1]